MIIKSKPLTPFWFKLLVPIIGWVLRRRCHRIDYGSIDYKPGHSYILMCNHFSFWDGFYAYYMCYKTIYKKNGMQRMYTMSLKKQMEKNKWLRYIGSFSVDPGKKSIQESFDYAAEILSTPGNLLLFYPQGDLESCYIRYIRFEDGLNQIIPNIKGDCQLIWCSNIIEYFESLSPTIISTSLDCGTNHEYNFEALKLKVNQFHLQSIQDNVRYTKEPIDYHF